MDFSDDKVDLFVYQEAKSGNLNLEILIILQRQMILCFVQLPMD